MLKIKLMSGYDAARNYFTVEKIYDNFVKETKKAQTK